jgi:hypothetical protein
MDENGVESDVEQFVTSAWSFWGLDIAGGCASALELETVSLDFLCASRQVTAVASIL